MRGSRQREREELMLQLSERAEVTTVGLWPCSSQIITTMWYLWTHRLKQNLGIIFMWFPTLIYVKQLATSSHNKMSTFNEIRRKKSRLLLTSWVLFFFAKKHKHLRNVRNKQNNLELYDGNHCATVCCLPCLKIQRWYRLCLLLCDF